jgi:DNA-binding NarL/FixJ family response regulator/tetratricopeptide (TPR) repeat protein
MSSLPAGPPARATLPLPRRGYPLQSGRAGTLFAPTSPSAIMPGMPRRVSSPVFVGRTAELATLEAALERAAAGTPAFVFLAGESGVGKSRLIAEFESHARTRGDEAGEEPYVLVGHCLELGGTEFAYAPLVEALRPIARDLAECRIDFPDGLSAQTRAALAELLPELGDGAAPVVIEREGGHQARLFEALLSFIDRLGQRSPVALVLEDAHWADSSTRDFLTFLVRSAHAEALCLVVTYRSDELHRRHPLRPLLAELERGAGVERIALERFSEDEVAAQLTGILEHPPAPQLAERLYERAAGNPLYTEELVAATQDGSGELPETLRDALLMRVERLGPAAQEVVRTAAGEWPMSHELLRAVCPLPEAELLDGAREAVANQVLVAESGGVYAFRHALVGEAVYGDLLPGERSALHARIAQALTEEPQLRGDAPGPTLSALLAWHWYMAHELPRALEASVRAGQAAQRVFAPVEAGQHFERALEVWARVPNAQELAGLDHIELLSLTASVANEANQSTRALALIRQAIADLDEHSQPLRAAVLHEQLGHFLRHAGRGEESWEAFDRAMELMPAEPPSPERAVLVERYATNLMLAGRFRRSAELADEALAEARRFGLRALESRALNTIGIAHVQLGDVDGGLAELREAVEVADWTGQPDVSVRAAINLSDILDLDGQTEEALSVVRRALAVIRERAAEPTSYDSFLAVQETEKLLRLGRLDEAVERLPERLSGESVGTTALFLHFMRAEIAMLRDDHDTVEQELESLKRLLRAADDPQWHQPLATLAAELALSNGQIAEARGAIADGFAALACAEDLLRATRLVWMGLRVEADAAARAGLRGEPGPDDWAVESNETMLEALESDPAMFGEGPHNLLLAHAERLRLRQVAGDSESAAEVAAAFARGAEAFEAIKLPVQAIYGRFREAEALVAAGDRATATVRLRAAHGEAVGIGLVALRGEIEALARRARIDLEAPAAEAGPAATEADDPAARLGLTPRELEVLLLVAEGRTNREVGAELFMSEKTASVHVSRILAKLGVSSRVEAAAVAHRMGLTAAARS